MTLNISLAVKKDSIPILAQVNKLRQNESLSSFLFEKCATYYLESVKEKRCPPINAPMPEWKRYLTSLTRDERFAFSECFNRIALLERKEFFSRL